MRGRDFRQSIIFYIFFLCIRQGSNITMANVDDRYVSI
jgi:hypothetical protein